MLIGLMVDDGGHAPYQPAIPVSQIILGLAEIKSRVVILAQGVEIVTEQSWRIILVALIQLVMEINESGQVFLCLYLLNLD